MERWVLRAAYPVILRWLMALSNEKNEGRDRHWRDCDCGFELLHRIEQFRTQETLLTAHAIMEGMKKPKSKGGRKGY